MTYIRMLRGFVYLAVVMDWYSRYVLACEISTTMDAPFCISALEQSLELSMPEIFNNMERIYESLGYRTPYEIYVKERLNPKPVQANTMNQTQPAFFILTMGDSYTVQ